MADAESPSIARRTVVDLVLPRRPESATAALVDEDIAIEDDRNAIDPGDRVLLIVEDDVTFARILVDMAHERGLKALVAAARQHGAGAGARVQAGRDHARHRSARHGRMDDSRPSEARSSTRHIPVHVITGDDNRRRALALGAMTYPAKSGRSRKSYRTVSESSADSAEQARRG